MNENNKKNIFIKILLNKIFQLTISIITFILVVFIVYKAINSRNKVEKFENKQNEIEEKIENVVKIEYPNFDENSYTGAAAISNCLKKPLIEEQLTDNMKNISKDLENLFNESNYNFAFKYKDLYTGFSISYNATQPIFGASTVKAPEAIYIYEKAEDKEINLEDTITYTSNYYSGGTGVLKNTNFNIDYNIHTLVGYSIMYSDNAAHLMLNNKYKSSNIYNFWKEKGTTEIYKNNTAWGNISANDSTIYMEELYNYYISNKKYSNELINYFYNSWKLISTPDSNIKIANKSGWSDTSLHDAAIVFDENPYTIVVLSTRGYVDYEDFFNKASTLIYKFHKEYWNTKLNICN